MKGSVLQGLRNWGGAAVGSAALLTGAGVMALTALPPPAPLFLDLGSTPPAAPAVAAIAERGPTVPAEAPADLVEPDTAPEPELPQPAPTEPAVAKHAPPKPAPIAPSEFALPAETKAAPKPPVRAKPTKKPAVEPAAKPAKKPKAAAPAPSVAQAPAAAAKSGGGKPQSAAAYAKSVMKKVRSTKKPSGAGRGAVLVGFTVGKDGGLATVKLLQGSGNPALDKMALDHIRRSAPFPAPPKGVASSFSFEFIGR